MPKRTAKARKPQKGKPEKITTRYFFYLIAMLLVVFTFLPGVLYYEGIVTMPFVEAVSSATISLFFPFAVFSYLLYRGKNLKSIINELGLSRDKLTIRNIGYGLVLFGAVIVLALALSLFTAVTNIPLPTNVQNVLAGTPLWFLVFTFLIAPINEEILFRGFLVPRFGVVLSATMFGILHLSYISISEFVAAFFFGLIAGYAFKKRRSLYSTILAHMLINFITITSLIYTGMYIHI